MWIWFIVFGVLSSLFIHLLRCKIAISILTIFSIPLVSMSVLISLIYTNTFSSPHSFVDIDSLTCLQSKISILFYQTWRYFYNFCSENTQAIVFNKRWIFCRDYLTLKMELWRAVCAKYFSLFGKITVFFYHKFIALMLTDTATVFIFE